MGGATSIDITNPGIDNAYGIKKLQNILSIDSSEIIFIGDALLKEAMVLLPEVLE
jgi:hypothetical protein